MANFFIFFPWVCLYIGCDSNREGVKLGRHTELPIPLVKRIKAERRGGAEYTAIARGLTEDGTPTAQGGARWYPATVQKILESEVLVDVS